MEIVEGLRWLAGQRLLRTLATMNAITSLVFGAWTAIMVLFAQDRLGLGSVGYGLLWSGVAAGSLLGSLVTARLSRLLGQSRLLLISAISGCCAWARSSLTGIGGWKMLTADQWVERTGWPMAWQLQGRYFENCSCDMVCPCTTSGLTMPADYERCRVVLVFHVDSGMVEDVDVSNLTVAVLADTPPLMADGNWRVGVFMDAAASQQQAEKLGAVFAGQLGGPMAMLAPLISEMLGVQTAPIEYVEDGRRHRVRIGDEVEIEIEDFVPPQTPEGEVEKLTGMFHPANSTLTIARATASRVNAFGLQFDNTGKNGHSAPFSWAA